MIGLLVFWSAAGRSLGKEMVRKIGGHVSVLCKPIIQRRLIDCLGSSELSNSVDSDKSRDTFFDEFKSEECYYHNRSNISQNADPKIIAEDGQDQLIAIIGDNLVSQSSTTGTRSTSLKRSASTDLEDI